MAKNKVFKSSIDSKIRAMKDEVTTIHKENPYERSMRLVAENSIYGVLMNAVNKKRRD